MKPEIRSKAEALAALRQQISHLETFQPLAGKAHPRLQIPEIDQHLPLGSFLTGAIHEFASKGFEDGAATEGFVSALISLINPKATILWITKRRTIFPPGLTVFGVDPDRVIFIELPRDQEILWATEEALRCQSITAVIAETSNPDMTATRRLQLAVENSGVTGFLLRSNPRKTGSSACVTSWKVQSMPSRLEEGVPGVGFPRWAVELVKARNGHPGSWELEWKLGQFHLITAKSQEAAPSYCQQNLRAL